jgi:hypothetical protein
MLERTDAVTNEVLEPVTFVLAYPNVFEGNIRESEANTHPMKTIFQIFIMDNKSILIAIFWDGTPYEIGRLVTDRLGKSAVFILKNRNCAAVKTKITSSSDSLTTF